MRQLAAIMFTDIVGYTAMMRVDERRTLTLVHYSHNLVKPIVENHNGTVIKEIGDGLLNTFSSALEALECAIDIQACMADVTSHQLRIGIHLSDVEIQDGDVYGDGVNYAARVEPKAPPGGICVSEAVYNAVSSHSEVNLKSIGFHQLKGIETPQNLYINHIEDDTLTPGDRPINGSLTDSIKKTFSHIPVLLQWLAAFLTGIYIIFSIYSFLSAPRPGVFDNRLAVLPFLNQLEVVEYDWLSAGISESISYRLSEVDSLEVFDKLHIKKTLGAQEVSEAGILSGAVLRKFAHSLDANFLITGSFQIFGDQVKVTAKLINAKTGVIKPLTEEVYSLSDPFKFQNDLCNNVLDQFPILSRQKAQ